MKFKWLTHERGGETQKGYIAVAAASGIALGSLAVIKTMEKSQGDDLKSRSKVMRQIAFEETNEKALELATQLLGNSLVTVEKAGGDTLYFQEHPDVTNTVNKLNVERNKRTYRVERINNRDRYDYQLVIDYCFSAPLSDTAKHRTFTHQRRGTNWVNRTSCSEVVRTRIKARQLVEPSGIEDGYKGSIKGAYGRNYLKVSSRTYSASGTPSGQREFTVRRDARLLYAPPAKTCTNDSEENCNVDHCKLMKPLRDGKGRVMYQTAKGNNQGDLKLQGFPLFRGAVSFPIPSSSKVVVGKVNKSDPPANYLLSWLNRAHAPGKVNPFEGWQGIGGSVKSEPLLARSRDGTVTLDMSSLNVNPDSLMRFDGYLTCPGGKCRGGSKALPWPVGKTYSQIKTSLKAGCRRTVGDKAPDFCTRVNLTYDLDRYYYKQMRRCQYYGPPRDRDTPAFDGLPEFAEDDGFIEYSEWQKVDKKTFKKVKEAGGIAEVQDKRKAYKDDESFHHHTVAENEQHKSVSHNFDRYLVGVYQDMEVKMEQVVVEDDGNNGNNGNNGGDDDDDDEAENDNDDVEAEPNTEYYARTVTSTFDVKCRVQDIPEEEQFQWSFEHKQSACFYMAYYNVSDRDTCSRSVHRFQCRNNNGCFAPGTPILMADGSQRPIEKVRDGDEILNPSTGKASKVLMMVVGDQKKDLYEIYYEGKIAPLRASHNHPFMTEKGYMISSELEVGTKLLGVDGEFTKVTKIVRKPKKDGALVYNLFVEGSSLLEQTYVAGGVVSGDYQIQTSFDRARSLDYAKFDDFLKAEAKGEVSGDAH